jgi:lipoprotein-releasing system ATP-binding protein
VVSISFKYSIVYRYLNLIRMSLLSASNIYKSYGSLPVLKGVDFEIRKGEIVSIVGPSGSGKSTLLHILGTLDQADQGILRISGETISARGVSMYAAPWWKRLLNWTIDTVLILSAWGSLNYFVTGNFFIQDDVIIPYSTGAAVGILYYFLFETFTGRTPGKFITGTKVFSGEGPFRPAVKQVALRTLARFIPFGPLEAFSFLASDPKGWHDTLPDTFVSGAEMKYSKKEEGRLSKQSLARFRNQKIGFIFQFHHLLPEFTALENVSIPAWIQGKKKKSIVKNRAEELLRILGLEDRMHHKPNELSGGEQQRVAVARALINDPDIVFADEPTGNLDSANARELHQLFFDLRNRLQQTFLIVTHNEELAQLSDRIVHMKDGKVL